MIDQMVTERNWAGNYGYQAPRIAHPSSVAELQELVAGARKIRALGSRHSFNDIADTTGWWCWTGSTPASAWMHRT